LKIYLHNTQRMNKLFIALLGAMVIVAVTAQRTCSVAIDNCLYCTSAGTVCEACNEGYDLSSANVCVQCTAANAATCDDTKPTVPSTCISGYGLDESGTTAACVKCTATQAADCDGSKPAVATGCNDGYALDNAPACVKCTATQAASCLGTTPDVAATCNEGYGLDAAPACVSCTTANCATCDGTKPAVCTGCKASYFLVDADKTCTQCMSDCAVCATATTCKFCADSGNLLNAEASECTFGYKATASFALIAAALLSFVF